MHLLLFLECTNFKMRFQVWRSCWAWLENIAYTVGVYTITEKKESALLFAVVKPSVSNWYSEAVPTATQFKIKAFAI